MECEQSGPLGAPFAPVSRWVLGRCRDQAGNGRRAKAFSKPKAQGLCSRGWGLSYFQKKEARALRSVGFADMALGTG